MSCILACWPLAFTPLPEGRGPLAQDGRGSRPAPLAVDTGWGGGVARLARQRQHASEVASDLVVAERVCRVADGELEPAVLRQVGGPQLAEERHTLVACDGLAGRHELVRRAAQIDVHHVRVRRGWLEQDATDRAERVRKRQGARVVMREAGEPVAQAGACGEHIRGERAQRAAMPWPPDTRPSD